MVLGYPKPEQNDILIQTPTLLRTHGASPTYARPWKPGLLPV